MAVAIKPENLMMAHFDSILNVLGDGIYISDRTGKTLKVNAMYEQLTGLKEEELIGRLVTDLVAEGKYDVALNPEIARTAKPKSSVQTTNLGRQVILDGYPVLDEKGNVALVVTFVRDITLLSQLQEQIVYQQEMIARCSELHFKKKHGARTVVVESKEMKLLLSAAATYAKTDVTIMLLGETGVGKDVLAKKIHETSPRCNQPFFPAVNLILSLKQSAAFGVTLLLQLLDVLLCFQLLIQLENLL